jgi:hypothetical protein
LATHTIELGLKGFLLLHGASEKQIRNKDITHNLAALPAKAKDCGLTLSASVCKTIELLGEPHGDYRPCYPLPTGKELITIEQCEPDIEEFLSAIRPWPSGA